MLYPANVESESVISYIVGGFAILYNIVLLIACFDVQWLSSFLDSKWLLNEKIASTHTQMEITNQSKS